MSENAETKQTEEHKPHLVKTIDKTTCLVICHFSETSRETLQDKVKRMILRDIQSGNVKKNKIALFVLTKQSKKESITADMCLSFAHDASLVGKVAAIRKDTLRPEYQSAPYQLVYVTDGNGARGKARGSACFCINLYSGESSRWERQDIQGKVKAECLPDWAKVRAEKIQKKEQDREEC